MAEGAPLLREYGFKKPIEGSNPSLSARKKSARYQRAFCFLLERPGENPLSRSEEGFDKFAGSEFGRTEQREVRPQGENQDGFRLSLSHRPAI